MRMRRGFTLVELLIVLAIIGVLMSIGIPVYTNQLEKAKARVIAANLKTIAQAAANLAILGENIDNFESSLTKIVKGLKNPSGYKIYIEKSTGGGTYNIYVYYNKTDVPTKLIRDEIGQSCDFPSITLDASGDITGGSSDGASPACVLTDVPNIGF